MNSNSNNSVIPVRELGRSGLRVSSIGFGAATLGGAYGAVDKATARDAIAAGLAAGMNFFDTSPFYGKTLSENTLGECLSGVARDRYVMATKVGRYDIRDFDFTAERIRRSVDESLQRLRCGHIDLLQLHDIEFWSLERIIEEAVPELQRLKQAGKVRAVGITGYPLAIFRRVLAVTEVDAILSYCHYTLADSTLADEVPWLTERGIGVINGSPLSMGLLSSNGPPAWHPASPALRAACVAASALCQRAGVELGELAFQYALLAPGIASTLVGIRSSADVERNMAVWQKPLDLALLAQVQAVLAPHHNQPWKSGLPENNGP